MSIKNEIMPIDLPAERVVIGTPDRILACQNLLRYCQGNGNSWKSFTVTEFLDFCEKKGLKKARESLARLLNLSIITLNSDRVSIKDSGVRYLDAVCNIGT